MDELREIWEHGSEEEREILSLALQAIRFRRERKSAYLSGFLGLSGRFLEDGTYEFVVPVTPFMLNRAGVVHGGITAALMDSTMGSLVNRSLSPGQRAVTAELKINYTRPGKTETLRSVAGFLHRGRTLAVCQGSVYDARGRLIAHATGSFMILDQPGTDG